jgi:hypothetical protein
MNGGKNDQNSVPAGIRIEFFASYSRRVRAEATLLWHRLLSGLKAGLCRRFFTFTGSTGPDPDHGSIRRILDDSSRIWFVSR